MYYKICNEEYTIIFKEGINFFDKLRVCINNRKILIVNIQGKHQEFNSMDKKQLNLIIDKYIKDNRPRNKEIIAFDELLKLSSEIQNEKYKIKNIFNVKKFIEIFNSSKFASFIVPIIGLLVAYFFYQLGYSFLYGFYFGGNTNEYISLIDMIVNPVPFNFKSITAIGIIYLILLIAYFVPLVSSIYENKISKKVTFFMIYLFIIFMMFIFNCVLFWGMPDDTFQKGIYLLILFLVIPVIIILIVSIFRLLFLNMVLFFSGIIYIFMFTFLLLRFLKVDEKSYLYLIGIAVGLVLVNFIISFGKPIVTKYEKFFKSKLIRFLSEIVLYIPFIFILVVTVMSVFKCKLNLISLFSIIVVISLIFVSSKDAIRKVKLSSKKDTNNNEKTRIPGNKKNDRRTFAIISCTMIMSIVCLCSIMIYLTTIAGKMIRESSCISSKDKIMYNDVNNKLESKLLFGSVVAQTDNIYFISKYPERKLVTVKALNIETYPCDKFRIDDAPQKFCSLKSNILKKYEDNIKKSGVLLNEMKNESKNSFKYTLDIKSHNEVMFSMEYSLDDVGNVIGFNLGMLGDFSKSNLVNDEYIKNLTDELMTMSINYYSIPSFEKSSRFYFSNGYLEYLRKEKGQISYEGYIFRKE